MDPILLDIYSTVLPSAPYVIAAYVLLWTVLFGFVVTVLRSVKKTETRLDMLEEALEDEGRSES